MADTAKIRIGPAGHNVRRNVRRLREEQRYSYVEMSERLADEGHMIPTLGLSKLERGERPVDADDLVALAAVFGITPGELLESPAGCSHCHGAPPPGFICPLCETMGLPRRVVFGEQPDPRSST